MSLTAVRPYIRLKAREIGLNEWADSFDFDNIPESILDKAFFIEMSDVTQAVKKNMLDQEMIMPCTVKIFTKGHRNPSGAIDTATQLIENLIKKCCDPKSALTQTSGIKNVAFDSARYEPISETNNNSVVASVVFRFLVILKLD